MPAQSLNLAGILFVAILLLSFCWALNADDTVSFSYPNDPSADFFLLGDAVESHGLIQLTSNSDLEAMKSSAGRFLCRTPIRMLDPETGETASFTTSFSFRIFTVNSSYQGDGMAFIISPDNYTVGSYGEHLGVFTSSPGGPNDHTFAVEFDTWQNDDVQDPNGNHIGLDATNITSFAYNNASNIGIQLNDGSLITAWVKYDGASGNLQVRLSTDSMEPVEPLIDANVSFATIFNEYMYVGFAGSTGLSNEQHTLLSWTFSSWGLQQPLSSSSDVADGSSRGKNGASIALTVCLVLVLLVLVVGLLAWKMTSSRRKSQASYFRRAKDYYFKSASCGYPRPFTYRELYAATKGFGEKQRLNKDNSHGSFFKGILVDTGAVVAVKRVAKDPQEGLQRFLHEVSLLISLPHRNLVSLQGWCLEKGEVLLVYEFMPNESLDKYLFSDQFDSLSWSQRHNIITGVADGLMHLHEGNNHLNQNQKLESECKQQHSAVLHRDVKASSVMLDNNFNARLGDYGLGRLVRRYKREDAMVLEGTFGYVAPEVVETGRLSVKTDVFSFGIVVLEVVCGRRAIDDEVILVDLVWELEKTGQILEAADKKLKGCFDVGETECLLRLGLLCTLPDPNARPTMFQVRSILVGESPLPQLPPCPKQPFRQLSCSSNNTDDVRSSLQISINELLSS